MFKLDNELTDQELIESYRDMLALVNPWNNAIDTVVHENKYYANLIDEFIILTLHPWYVCSNYGKAYRLFYGVKHELA